MASAAPMRIIPAWTTRTVVAKYAVRNLAMRSLCDCSQFVLSLELIARVDMNLMCVAAFAMLFEKMAGISSYQSGSAETTTCTRLMLCAARRSRGVLGLLRWPVLSRHLQPRQHQ